MFPVTIQISRQEESGPGGGRENKWQCVASCESMPNERVQEIFQGLHDGGLNPQEDWDDFGLRGLELLGPEPYRSFVDSTEKRLTDMAFLSLSVLQWRLQLQGGHAPLRRQKRLLWSFDGDDWRVVPGIAGARAGQVGGSRKICGDLDQSIKMLIQKEIGEPLGHELLREAIALKGIGGRRSAFVVAMMAAEVGLKECIADLLPETKWLEPDKHTPSLIKLIEEYLPKLPARCPLNGEVPSPPDSLCDKIKTGVVIRNDVVHKGCHGKLEERLEETIGAVRDLLFLLDYYRGHSWAINAIQPDHREMK